MFRNIKYIIYEKNVNLAFTEYFQIEINDDKNLLKYTDTNYIGDIREKKPIIEEVSDEAVLRFVDQLYRIIYNWNDTYECSNVIDGAEWKLQIKYKNDEIKYYSGKNEFPSNFEYLDNIKDEIIKNVIRDKYKINL